MTWRIGACVCAVLLLPLSAEGQAIRRVRPKAFPLAVTLSGGPSWGGMRAGDRDTTVVEHGIGSGPKVGLELQFPVVGTFGIGLAAQGGRPSRVLCNPTCVSPDRLTTIHGAGLILWRFKAQAPIYFGFGPALSYIKPGAVSTQTSAVTEIGGALVAGYDFALSPTIGGRLAWWNYFLKPSTDDLPASFVPSSLVWDTQVAIGVRFVFGGL